MYRISVLSENTAAVPDLRTEHGLSVCIETGRHILLMDSGWTDIFLDNAEAMGVPAAQADTLILSHNHFDHGLSMPLFFDRRPEKDYRLFLAADALWPAFARTPEGLISAGSGMGNDYLLRRRIPHVYVEEPVFRPFPDEPEIALLTNFERRCDFEPMSERFLQQRGGALVRDEFRHEMALALPCGEGLALLTGCAHSGVCNMILAAEERLGKPVTMVLGGTHLMICEADRVMKTIEFLNGKSALRTAAVCHCTGAPALELFREHCVSYVPCGTGSVFTVE